MSTATEAEGNAPEVNGNKPQVNGNMPQVNGHEPQVNGNQPEINGDVPRVNGDTSHVNGDTPQVNGDAPQVNGDAPQVNGSTPQVNGNTSQITPQQAIEEFVTERLLRWQAKQIKVPDRELGAQIAARCCDYETLGSEGPGCLLPDPDPNGSYVFVPYDARLEGLPEQLLRRNADMNAWLKDTANSRIIAEMDKILEKEVNKHCFWEFLDDRSNAARIDFSGKIDILAKYRLMLNWKGFDVSPKNPHHPEFQFIAVDISEYGVVNMQKHTLPWSCTEREVVARLDAFSPPQSQYTLHSVHERQQSDLSLITHPSEAATHAQSLTSWLQTRDPYPSNESEWIYFLARPEESHVPVFEKNWRPLKRQPNDIKLMKRLSREAGGGGGGGGGGCGNWAVIVRSWQYRHYRTCCHIYKLQAWQAKHCEEVEGEARARAGDVEFSRG